MTAFIVHAMPAGAADPCSAATRAVVAEGREPCRRCLRNARTGENLLLIPYDPFLVRSPYTGEGPVYVHADGCDEHRAEPDVLPEQVDAPRQFSVRAYDADAMLLDAAVVPAGELAATARALLGTGAEFLHAHFAGPGCFAFRIDRAGHLRQ
ncbi:MAG TPA: DUF1203 domain-containing protein [Solirubrobacteraceae bacterium]|nr:DUF1203 domain-containing protein [Solirubrobacteraceae bacterium]